MYTIHPLSPNQREYCAFAAVAAAFSADLLTDFETTDPGELRAFDAAFVRVGQFNQRLLAFAPGGQVVASAHIFQIPWLPHQASYWLTLRVLPGCQRQGIGGSLYAQILQTLQQRHATTIWLMVPERLPAIVAYVAQSGYHERLRTYPYTLDVATSTAYDTTAQQARLADSGITIATLAELLASQGDWCLRLHQLHMELTREVPLPEQLFTTATEFADWVTAAPGALPDAYFVALDQGMPIGQSFMQRDEAPGTLHQEVTGVLPAYRGHGIASVLKARTISYAQQHSYQTISTWVESNNAGMIAINQRAGFTRGSGIILFEKELP